MSHRSLPARMLWLLVAALLLRAAMPAHVMPVPSLPANATSVPAGHCHAGQEAAAPLPVKHDDPGCRIACDLAAAPLLVALPAAAGAPLPPLRVARATVLALADPAPPDHPPPI